MTTDPAPVHDLGPCRPRNLALMADHLVGQGLTGADDDVWVFTSPHGGPLDYSHFRRRVWGPATAAAGLDAQATSAADAAAAEVLGVHELPVACSRPGCFRTAGCSGPKTP